MEEIFIVIFEFLFEIVLQVLIELPFDWLLGARESRSSQVANRTIWIGAALGFGAGLGLVSLIVRPHSFIKSSELRVAYLFAAPVLSAATSLLISRLLAKRSRPWITPRLHAWCAFYFTVIFTVLRFTYANH